MTSASTAAPNVHGYHVHVYYDRQSLPAATRLREELTARFPVEAGQLPR